MSEFCLLAVSLLSQGQIPGWQLGVPAQPHSPLQFQQPLPPAQQDARSASAHCRSSIAKETIAAAEAQQPEFSASASAPVSETSATRGQPHTRSTDTLPQRLSIAAASLELPGLDALAYLPDPAPLDAGLRPVSGSQLYHQRLAALRSGTLYTRLPLNTYQAEWVNATVQPTYEQWISLLAAEAAAIVRGQGTNQLTVMVGDSLCLWYPREQLSSDRFWLNQGISGDTTAGVLRRLSAFAQTRPDTIQVMVGINDLRRGATDAEVLNNLRQIMRQLRHNHPDVEIFVQSILPTRLAEIPSSRIHQINDRLALIAQQEGVQYLDLRGYFADANGDLHPDLTTDGLHLSPRGYAVWQTALQQTRS
jgi:lysophospholipase L1-like esterase